MNSFSMAALVGGYDRLGVKKWIHDVWRWTVSNGMSDS